MKKNLLLLAAAGMFILNACGPSAEEQAAAAKATQDSLAAVEQATADSIAAAMQQQAMQDSMNMAMEKMRQDSIAMADEMAAMKKKGIKPKKKEEPKPTGVTKGGVPIGGTQGKDATPPVVTKGGKPIKK